jgi:uncharacterized protein YwgA
VNTTPSSYRWLAGIVAAHPKKEIVGRTRLQKTVRILQSLGLPTKYRYTNYFYGPYSEDLQSDITLLDGLHLLSEIQRTAQDGEPYYIITAQAAASIPEVKRFSEAIDTLSETDPVVLELAATYLAFRESGSDPTDAKERLRRKKGAKTENGREAQAIALLKSLGLPKKSAATSG